MDLNDPLFTLDKQRLQIQQLPHKFLKANESNPKRTLMNVSRARSTASQTATASAKATASSAQTKPRYKGNSTRTTSAEMNDIKFESLKGAYYHEGREAHFDMMHRALLFLVTFLGTATASQLLAAGTISPTWTGLATAVVGLIDLVFDLSGKARNHGFLRRRLIELNGFCDDPRWKIDALKERLHSIYADEPPQFKCANAIAYNNALRTIHGNDHEDALLVVSDFMATFRNWFRFESYDFKTKDEQKKLGSN